MGTFDKSYSRLQLVEGGYANNPNDSGGETYKGIARNFHKDWAGWAVIDEYKQKPGFPANIPHILLAPKVKEFYRAEFWDSCRLDDVALSSEKIAAEIFDTFVNSGRKGQYLQRALNALNQQTKDYPDLKVDGDIGPATIAALRSFMARRGSDGEAVILAALNAQQTIQFLESVENNEKNEEFFFGWVLQRVVKEAL